ncbi:MAG TPA: phospholipid carrier-dependent glycosyltransferase [Anaerolineales bacterium]|nr:phospholipid carrier-dependent glycosyltransferase [Anaerolineales bacterium]
MTKSHSASFLILGLLALSGTFLILYATPQGMGLFDDSIAYIAGARSIVAGQGYREAWLASNQPVTHFPPGFSTVLALVGISGLDPLRGTRLVNAVVFGANIFLLGLIGWRMTKSKLAGMALSALLLLSGELFRVHTTAMSEPLYIFFTLAAFLAFSQTFVSEEKQTNKFLLLASALTAFAYLTRYAGLALFATFLVSLFLLHPTWKQRLTSAGIFLAGFVPFALAWAVRNRLLTDNATNRKLVYHPITPENIQLGISNFASFILPIEEWRKVLIKVPNLVAVILIALILALLGWVVLKGLKKFFNPASPTPEVLSFVSTLYVFGYLASILSSMTLFDASTKFQLRILAPVYVSLLIMLVYFGYWLWQKQKIALILLSLVAFSFSVSSFTSTLTQLRKGGQGYASFQWFDSEAMKFMQNLPAEARIYSNETAAVYLYTDHPGYVLPDLIDPVTGLPRGRFDEGVKALQEDVLSGNAVLALFDVDSQDEDVQSTYQILANGLYLAFDKQGDKIYTAYP